MVSRVQDTENRLKWNDDSPWQQGQAQWKRGRSFTNFDGEAWRQAQSDEVAQLCKQGVGDGHEVNDRGHLLCQGERMGLTQPQLGLKPAKHQPG